EAIDEEGLAKYRKRISLGRNFEALEFARTLGIKVAINIIVDPDWDEQRFATVRDWCLEIPEIVNLSINTPYPGTESWLTEERHLTSRDYRLFDIQHAVLPTKLPLPVFYRELLRTQRVLYRKHLNWMTAPRIAGIALRLLLQGQTNFVRGMLHYNSIYNLEKMLADHAQPVAYQVSLPPPPVRARNAKQAGLYVHAPRGRAGRSIDDSTERFVDATRTNGPSANPDAA
ncbi:MAG TPA: hopanoid C-3 methylase HpnR, partial [Dongiaceae bacterium]